MICGLNFEASKIPAIRQPFQSPSIGLPQNFRRYDGPFKSPSIWNPIRISGGSTGHSNLRPFDGLPSHAHRSRHRKSPPPARKLRFVLSRCASFHSFCLELLFTGRQADGFKSSLVGALVLPHLHFSAFLRCRLGQSIRLLPRISGATARASLRCSANQMPGISREFSIQ